MTPEELLEYLKDIENIAGVNEKYGGEFYER
jgi:hypothetical protein